MVGVALVAFAFVQSCKKAESAAARPEEAAQAGRVTQIAGQRIDGGPTAYVWAAVRAAVLLVRQGLLGPDVVVAGEQVAGVVLALYRGEPLVGFRWVDRGDILLGG